MHDDRVLNGIWIGLLSVEALMVLGVTISRVLQSFRKELPCRNTRQYVMIKR